MQATKTGKLLLYCVVIWPHRTKGILDWWPLSTWCNDQRCFSPANSALGVQGDDDERSDDEHPRQNGRHDGDSRGHSCVAAHDLPHIIGQAANVYIRQHTCMQQHVTTHSSHNDCTSYPLQSQPERQAKEPPACCGTYLGGRSLSHPLHKTMRGICDVHWSSLDLKQKLLSY